MYRMTRTTTGETASGGTIRLGGVVYQADIHTLDGWIAKDHVTALQVEDLVGIRPNAVQPFVRLVRQHKLTVYGSDGSTVFGDLYSGGLALGRELVAQVREAG